MCKILVMSGMDTKRTKLNMEFIKAMAEIMSENNKDGLGYSAIDKDGKMFGERWLFNFQAFQSRVPMTQPRKREHSKFAGIKDMVKGFLDLEDEPEDEPFQKYMNFGVVTDEMTAITLHTRMATSEKGFHNVHPFVDLEADTSVIHNGVINNVSKVDHIRSTCDSERILNKYIYHDVGKVPADHQNMMDELKGYMACGIFSRNHVGKRVLDVFNTRARLAAAFIKELNCLVFSTDLQDIRAACRDVGLTIVSKGISVKPNTLARFDAVTGKLMFTQEYKDNSDTNWHQRGYNSNNHYDKEWEEMLARREGTKTSSTIGVESNVVNLPRSEADVVASQEKAASLITTPALPTLPEVVQAQVNAVIAGSTEVDAIINRNSSDNYNEKEAGLNGYELDDSKTIWVRKSGVKH